MAIILMLFMGGGMLVAVVSIAKARDQRAKDSQRVFYGMYFTQSFDHDKLLRFVRSMAGVESASRLRLRGVASIVLEQEANETGVRYRLGVPFYLGGHVRGQLRAAIPGVHFQEDARSAGAWTLACQFSGPARLPLRIHDPEATAQGFRADLTELKPGEAILRQLVFTPEGPDSRPRVYREDETSSTRRPPEPTFLTMIRVAVKARDNQRAGALINRVRMSLQSISTVPFERRFIPPGLMDRIATPHEWPSAFNAPELAALLALSADTEAARIMPPDAMIPETGIVFADSNVPGAERPLALTPRDMLKHVHIMGPTGVGKSTLLENLAIQIIESDHGLTVVEPKGDLIEGILNRIPRERINDVVLLDPTDTHPVALNALADSNPERITSQIVGLFKKIYSDAWGPRLDYILRYAVMTAAIRRLTLCDIVPLFTNDRFREQHVGKINNPGVVAFWKWWDSMKPGERNQVVAPAINKLDAFLWHPNIQAILGQEGGLNMHDILSERKILLVPLTKGVLGDQASAMFGSLVFSRQWQAVLGRAELPQSQRSPYFCILDEFQNYMSAAGTPIGDILAEARGYGYGLIKAHQHLGQLSKVPGLKDDVAANSRTKVVFQANATDAKEMSKQFDERVSAHDIQQLGPFEAYIQAAAGDRVCAPASGRMKPPGQSLQVAEVVRAASRANYASDHLAVVAARIAARHGNAVTKPTKRKRIGKDES